MTCFFHLLNHRFAVVILLWVNGSNVFGRQVNIECTNSVELPDESCVIVRNVIANDNDFVNILNADEYKNITNFQLQSDSSVPFVPATIFKLFPRLTAVELFTGIKSLTNESFLNANSLRILTLQNNKITKIDRGVFSMTTQLHTINLINNHINDIEDNSFNGLSNLRHLFLSRNFLTVLRKSTFRGAVNLTDLKLSFNQINSIEVGTFDLPLLESINLGYNKLKAVSNAFFSGAPKLKILFLETNELRDVRQSFEHLDNLQTLFLSNNPIEEIDLNSFTKLPQLIQLYLANTTLKDDDFNAPVSTEQTNKLQIIDLSQNNLSKHNILSILEGFKNLNAINLEHNELTIIDDLNVIRLKFPHIEMVSIGCNRLPCEWLRTQLTSANVTFENLYCPDPELTTSSNVNGISCI